MLAIFNSSKFAMIMLIIMNRLNRHERDLNDAKTESPTLLKRIYKTKIIVYDIVRCLLKNVVLSSILKN